jgi:hypothetical protein
VYGLTPGVLRPLLRAAPLQIADSGHVCSLCEGPVVPSVLQSTTVLAVEPHLIFHMDLEALARLSPRRRSEMEIRLEALA